MKNNLTNEQLEILGKAIGEGIGTKIVEAVFAQRHGTFKTPWEFFRGYIEEFFDSFPRKFAGWLKSS